MNPGKPIGWRQWMTQRTWIAVCAVLLCLPASAFAELTVVEKRTDEGTLITYRLTVTPACEPNPALRHRLSLREIDLRPGNAAMHYMRAFPEGGIEATWDRVEQEYGEEFDDWRDAKQLTLGQLPLAKARVAAATFDTLIDDFIAPATCRRDCDWGLEVEEMRGVEIVQLRLPEFQATRTISRILSLRARVAIADGDYDRALAQLRMNYRLAENVGSEPLLICGLIGLAEAGIANDGVIEFIGAKDSPNLYWALAELPQPLVDIRKAVQFEMSLGLRVFPVLRHAETANHSPSEWARLLAESLGEVNDLTGTTVPGADASIEMRQLLVAGLALLQYPPAKQRLIEHGMDADVVEALPVGQVLTVDAAGEYRRVADEMEKWMHVPYYFARTREKDDLFVADPLSAATRGYGYLLARLLLPAVQATQKAQARLAWQVQALQVVEAIRMHAAGTGRLPATLDDIKVVPVPLNPVTNRSFRYHLADDTAVLEMPVSDGVPGTIGWRFEIRLATDQ